jgi:outer membrane protease
VLFLNCFYSVFFLSLLLLSGKGLAAGWTTSLGVAQITGLSQDLVFKTLSNDSLLSQLTWNFGHTELLKCVASYETQNATHYRISAENVIGSGRYASLLDLDWDYPNGSWTSLAPTDYSTHPAFLHRALQITVDTFYPLFHWRKKKGWQGDMDFLMGVQYMNYRWDAQGGFYIYRQSQGALNPFLPGIIYDQKFLFPYYGALFTLKNEDWHLALQAWSSSWVLAHTKDQHILRGLYFEENYQDGFFGGLRFQAEYRFSKGGSWTAYHEWQRIKEIRDGYYAVRHHHQSTGLGLSYRWL